MDLNGFQQAFLRQITQINNESEGIDPLIRVLSHDTRMTPHERLGIYVRDYRGRLLDVLMDHYPQTYTYLGEYGFLELFEAYISQYPPSSYSLRYWGDNLSDFCKKTISFNQPELIDLIRFEWIIHDLYDGADAPVLSSTALGQVEPEHWMDLRFQVIPCLKLWQANTNVAMLWQNLKDNKPTSIQSAYSCLVHWRKDCIVYFRELKQQEWGCLECLSQGETVGDLCESLTKTLSDEEAPQVFSQYLQSWINDGMIQETPYFKVSDIGVCS